MKFRMPNPTVAQMKWPSGKGRVVGVGEQVPDPVGQAFLMGLMRGDAQHLGHEVETHHGRCERLARQI